MITDDKGNALAVGDTVAIICWGYNVSLSMTQGTHKVVGFGTKRVKVAITHFGGKVVAIRPEMLRKVEAK